MKSVKMLFCLLIIVSGCVKEDYNSDEKSLIDFLNGKDFLKTKSCVIVIPIDGCGTCTQDIIDFSKVNYKNEQVIFVYSAWDRQGKALFKDISDFEEYVMIDKKSVLKSLGIVENMPVIFFIEDGKLTEKVKFEDVICDTLIQNIILKIK